MHSAAMEGLAVTLATRADADEYAAGAIDVDELIGRSMLATALAEFIDPRPGR